MNIGSLLLTIDRGIPCKCTTLCIKVFAIKCMYLDSLFTTTSIASMPLDLGSHLMKSMIIFSQMAIGIDKGYKRPAGEEA